jgi:response regulator RpfG family c-di-GMP phosphodiesterase
LRRNLLIVSESGRVRDALASGLRSQGFSVTLVATGDEALRVVRSVVVDSVLIESRHGDPRSSRLQDDILKLRPSCRIAIVTSFAEARSTSDLLRLGIDDYVVDSHQLLELVRLPDRSGDRRGAPQVTRAVKSLMQTVDVLVGLIELDDRFFSGSSHQAMRLSRAMTEELSEEEEVVLEVSLAALLRDIGKAGVATEVLEQSGELSPEQVQLMREHVDGSVRLLEHVDFPWKVREVIRHHHERYDGTGYPDGLKGREIPLGSRILAVADAYVAMISERSHRSARKPQEALEEIERQAGVQFDPEVVEVFLRVTNRRAVVGRSGAKPKVLLADPDRESRKLFKMKLINEGFAVQAVSSLRRARAKLRRAAPQLVLAACGDDPAEALDLMQEARDDGNRGHVPFALLADTDDRILKVRALRQGVDDFLVKNDDMEELVARVENIIAREARRSSGGTKRSGITGQLENMPLADIVQTLSMGMKTAMVTLTESGDTGKLWFRDGKIVHAECGDEDGEAAFFRMLRWSTGEFLIQHGIKAPKDTIDTDPMFLVLEGMRRIDQDGVDEAEAS